MNDVVRIDVGQVASELDHSARRIVGKFATVGLVRHNETDFSRKPDRSVGRWPHSNDRQIGMYQLDIVLYVA